jgi:hypothetical protein
MNKLFVTIIVFLLLGIGLGYSSSEYLHENQLSEQTPGDWISKDSCSGMYDLHTKEYRLTIKQVNGSVSFNNIAGTGSMFPVLGEHSLVLCQKTNFYDSLQVGDIIIFEKDEQRVIHRIIRKSMDEQGSYVVTKGDNNMRSDLNSFGKIREDQIRGVVIGILY